MTKYLVLTYNPWDSVQLNNGIPLTKNPELGSGFLVVFDTKEEALKYWPGKEVNAIRFTTIQKETDNE